MPEKINVLFVQSQSVFGADSQIHASLMRYLDRSRFTVHVACTVEDGPSKTVPLLALERIPDLHLRRTRFAPGYAHRTREEIWRGVRGSLLFPVDLAQLVAYVRRHRIHVLHGTEKSRDAAYVVALGKATGAKSVVHVHIKWAEDRPRAAKWAVREADAAIGISKYVTDTIVGMGKPRSAVHTVLNALDAETWDPSTDGGGVRRELGIAGDAPLLASVSRLYSWKGQRELVSALALVKKRIPGVRLLIVGEDEVYAHGGSFTAELRALAEELGVKENVIFTGPRGDVREIMAACDLYTMPAFEEGFGIVFLEAMAMKKPVIAVDNGGTPEVVEHGRTGLLSPPWDVPALAANIVQLLEDRERRLQMGHVGRARVLERFNPRRMADDAASAYEAILAARAGR